MMVARLAMETWKPSALRTRPAWGMRRTRRRATIEMLVRVSRRVKPLLRRDIEETPENELATRE